MIANLKKIQKNIEKSRDWFLLRLEINANKFLQEFQKYKNYRFMNLILISQLGRLMSSVSISMFS